MAVLVDTVITKARKLLDDSDKSTWPDDDDLLGWYNDGVLIIRSDRPDTQLDTDGSLIAYAEATDPATDEMIFAEPEKWRLALADYIAHRGFGEDAGDHNDTERSQAHWDEFSRYLATL